MTSTEAKDFSRKRRRDFEHNRDAILRAANAAFVEVGARVSISAIAQLAGVAPATIYRHFPNRTALVDAVLELRVIAYLEAIESSQNLPDPHAAFRQMVHMIVELQARDRSFREILTSLETHPLEHPAFLQFGEALLGALENARAAKVVREDVTDADIMLLLIATEGIARPTDDHSRPALHRLVDIALDGLCNSRTELQGAPLEFDQVLEVTRS